MQTLSPIVLFVYNRPWHTEQTLNALMKNDLADESVLYIYADAAKENTSEGENEKINEVRKIIHSKQWCKEIHIVEAEKNKGLADSIVGGVTEVVNRHGSIIVLEDDIVTSKGFLKYMNEALSFYEKHENVLHVSGYMYPHKETLPETFFFKVPLCWGWATWKRAWSFYNSDTEYLIDHFDRQKQWESFNKFGGSYLEYQLRANLSGQLKTWFIKWHSSVMLKEGLTLFPGVSLVENIGFDGTGVHNGSTGFFSNKKITNSVKIAVIPFEESAKGEKIIKNFYASLMTPVVNFTLRQRLKNIFLNLVPFKGFLKKTVAKFFYKVMPELSLLKNKNIAWENIGSYEINTSKGLFTKVNTPFNLYEVSLGDYSYISQNSVVSKTTIGKFCSIGPNFLCGWGIHPIDGISTAPVFYSTLKQNGTTFSSIDKVIERKRVYIGNDVFIGANVTILDGISIGDGAVIGAGAVVSKDIPAYAVAVGNPIKVIKFRFNEQQVESLLKIKWWNFEKDELTDVEKHFFEIDTFIQKYKHGD